MALMLFITPNIQSSLVNNLLARSLMQWARVCKNSKWIMKINTDGNTPMEGIVTFTMFPVYTLTSFLASLSGHSSSYIELQQNAIEWVSLWLTHNNQNSMINNLIIIPKNYIFDQPSIHQKLVWHSYMSWIFQSSFLLPLYF